MTDKTASKCGPTEAPAYLVAAHWFFTVLKFGMVTLGFLMAMHSNTQADSRTNVDSIAAFSQTH